MKIKSQKMLRFLGFSAVLFSTSCLQAWTTGVAVSTDATSVNPTPSYLAIDSNSNAIAGWLGGDIGTANESFSASLPAGAAHWNAPVSIYAGTSPEFTTFPVLFSDASGNVNALWAQFHQGETSFDQATFLSSSQPLLGSSWSAPIASDTIDGFTDGGAVEVDELGNRIGIIAIGPDSNTFGPPFTIYRIALAGDASAWTTPVEIGTDTSTSQPAIFALASGGEAVVGWRIDTALHTARYTFSSDDFAAIDDINLPSGTTDIGYIRGALASNGDAVVVFGAQIGAGSNYVAYYSLLPSGSSTWTFPEQLSDAENNTNGQFLSLKTDVNAKATIVWGELTPSNDVFIRAANLPFGESLSTIVNLTDPNPPVSTTGDGDSGIHVDVDAFGNSVAIWQFVVDTSRTVQIASKPVGGSWSTVSTLSSSGSFPRVALSDQGTAIASWLDMDASRLYASTSNHLFALAGPSGFTGYVVEEDDAISLRTHWTASLAPHVVNYEIFKNDVLIASVSPSVHEYSIGLDCPTLEDSYTLVAVASNGNKSTPLALVVTD